MSAMAGNRVVYSPPIGEVSCGSTYHNSITQTGGGKKRKTSGRKCGSEKGWAPRASTIPRSRADDIGGFGGRTLFSFHFPFPFSRSPHPGCFQPLAPLSSTREGKLHELTPLVRVQTPYRGSREVPVPVRSTWVALYPGILRFIPCLRYTHANSEGFALPKYNSLVPSRIQKGNTRPAPRFNRRSTRSHPVLVLREVLRLCISFATVDSSPFFFSFSV